MKVCVFSGQKIESRISGGYQERICNLYSNLARSGWEVELFCGDYVADEYSIGEIRVNVIAYPTVTKNWLRLMGNLILRTKSTYGVHTLAFAFSPSILSSSKEAIVSADIVVIEGAFFILPLIYAKLHNKPVVLDIDQVVLQYFITQPRIFRNPLNIVKNLVVSFFEIISCSLATRISVVTEGDKRRLSRFLRIGARKIYVIENGVDTQASKNDMSQGKEIRKTLGISDRDKVITFVGNLKVHTNFSAAKYIAEKLAPEIFKHYPQGVYFMIVGGYEQLPPSFTRNKRIIFTNWVDDLVPYMSAADICIAPLDIGTGTKTKIFLYMAYQKPIVTTEIGAEGINLVHGQNAIICDTESFTDSLVHLIEDSELRRKLGNHARTKAVEEYDWRHQAINLDFVLKSVR